jgi:hypothetical protein
MRISFDLDETLICRRVSGPVETAQWPTVTRWWFNEPLRHGTRALFGELQRRGCSLWIYTTSGRSPWRIRAWLWLHGIRVDGVVNDRRHRHAISGRRFSRIPSKFPPAFAIDLHVDDSEGVLVEGNQHGFRVLVVRPGDDNWTQQVLNTAGRDVVESRPSAR